MPPILTTKDDILETKDKIWRCVESDGLPAVGDKIHPGEIFINKHVPKSTREIVTNPNAIPSTAYVSRPEIFKGNVIIKLIFYLILKRTNWCTRCLY